MISANLDGLQYSHFLKRPLPRDVYTALRRDAFSCWPNSQRIVGSRCILETEGEVNGRGKSNVSGPGPELNAFHSGFGMHLAQELAEHDGDIIPTRASFLFYETNDYTFFHHDAITAHITVIVGLSEHLRPLILYPHFGCVTSDDVAKLNTITEPDLLNVSERMSSLFGSSRAKTVEIELPAGSAIAIPGRRIPHMRPIQSASSIVCAACYAFVFPQSRWLTPRHEPA